MKIQNKLILGVLGITAMTTIGGCTKDFEKLNEPYKDVAVATASPAGIFNNLSRRATNEDYTLWTCFLMPTMNQQGVQNVTVPYTNYINSYWSNYYLDLADYRLLLKLIAESASPESYGNLKAMATILIGHKTLQMVDRYGKIPYSQAAMATEGIANYRPAYDDEASIYKSVLADLATAVNSIKTGSAASAQVPLGTYESFLASDYDAWVKFGNSIRLRYAVRLYGKEQALSAAIITEIVGGSKPLPNAQVYANNQTTMQKNNYGLYPQLITPAITSSAINLGDRLWYTFREASVSNIRLSDNVWKQISATNADDGSGIFDPRAKVWFMPNNAGKWVPQPQDLSVPDGGNIYPNTSANAPAAPNTVPTNKFAGFNFYLVRDFLSLPYVMISEADVHFLKAEIYAKGMGVAANFAQANAEYQAGLTSSVNFWYSYVASTNGGIWPSSKPALGATDIATFLAHPNVALVPGDDANNVKKIITQAWLAAIFEAPEAWAISRRTGLTPKSATFTPPNIRKLPYPNDESVNNRDNWTKAGNGDAPDVEAAKKVYWMP